MRNQNLSDADLAAYSSEHLLYEFQMLSFAEKELGKYTKAEPIVSALIESYGIHLRNLIDFFCTPTGNEQPDDVIASDFYPGWNEPVSNTLKDAKERINKELSHLTLKRKSDQDPTKPWDVGGLYKEILAIGRRFAAQASPTKLSPVVKAWLQPAANPAIAVVAAFTTSNTTTAMVTTTVVVVPPPKKTP